MAVQVQWDRNMRRVMVIEADVQEGSTPLRDLFDQIASWQTKITFAQLKVQHCLCQIVGPTVRGHLCGCQCATHSS